MYKTLVALVFITCGFVFADVVLVPKPGSKPKSKPILEYSAEVGDDGGAIEPDVVLRKQKKERKVSSNNKKNKKKKKNLPSLEDRPSDDLERIYLDEKKLLESTQREERLKRGIASSLTPKEKLIKIEEKYKKALFAEIEIEKEIYQELLESTKNYKGVLYFDNKGQLKMVFREPVRSEVLITEKNVYTIDYPIDEAQNKVQILRSTRAKSLKTHDILSLLWGKKKLEELFNIELKSIDGNNAKFEFRSKNKKQTAKSFELSVDVSKEVFKTISYVDEIGNKTTYYFKKHTFLEKSPEGLFKFQQPNNASITDI